MVHKKAIYPKCVTPRNGLPLDQSGDTSMDKEKWPTCPKMCHDTDWNVGKTQHEQNTGHPNHPHQAG